jgi:hypothetical protein
MRVRNSRREGLGLVMKTSVDERCWCMAGGLPLMKMDASYIDYVFAVMKQIGRIYLQARNTGASRAAKLTTRGGADGVPRLCRRVLDGRPYDR